MNVFVLRTDLFNEKQSLEDAIAHMKNKHNVEIFDTTLADINESDWDCALKGVLAADRTITL